MAVVVDVVKPHLSCFTNLIVPSTIVAFIHFAGLATQHDDSMPSSSAAGQPLRILPPDCQVFKHQHPCCVRHSGSLHASWLSSIIVVVVVKLHLSCFMGGLLPSTAWPPMHSSGSATQQDEDEPFSPAEEQPLWFFPPLCQVIMHQQPCSVRHSGVVHASTDVTVDVVGMAHLSHFIIGSSSSGVAPLQLSGFATRHQGAEPSVVVWQPSWSCPPCCQVFKHIHP